jgi:hypothetical protein
MTTDDDRTDLASALLDGTLPEATAAAARRDPAVMARMAELQRARDRVRDVPPAPVEGRDVLLAAALDAFDADRDETAAAVSPVAELRARREARGARRVAPRWLGAAAAVALVVAALGAVAVLSQQSADEDQASSLADESLEAGTGAGDDSSTSAELDQGGAGAADAPPEPSVAAPRSAPAVLGDLGSFATPADLVARVRADADSFLALSGEADAESSLSQPGAASGCVTEDLPPVLRDAATTLVALGSATVDGEAVTVWMVETPSGQRVVAVDVGCRLVVDRLL